MTCKGHQEGDAGPVPELRPLGLKIVLSTSIICILTVRLAEGGGLQAGVGHMHLSLEAHLKTQEKMAYFLSIPRGLPGRMGLSLGSAGNSPERKRLHCLWAYFSKYKMKLSSRQPFFFFLNFLQK